MLKFAAILMLFVLVCPLLALQVKKNEKTFRRRDITKMILLNPQNVSCGTFKSRFPTFTKRTFF